ncbi:MAG: hypothetical protein P8176_12575, partial [Gammaproteobacteria bacterium]
MKNKIFEVLDSMDILDAAFYSKLDDDLGMDSQEIVSFMDEVQNAYGTILKDGEFKRSMTVLDCLRITYRKKHLIPKKAENFTHTLLEDAVIRAPCQSVYDGLCDVSTWQSKLPHITDIKIIYNDGEFQEFIMGVNGADGHALKVRSIRRCSLNHITFFQPEPPPFLRYHCGGWCFIPIDDDLTYVSTYHH